jgi:hypothetical protein
VKIGDRVRTRSGFVTGTITSVYWKGAAGSGVSYIGSVEVTYPNGMVSVYDPSHLEVIDENA